MKGPEVRPNPLGLSKRPTHELASSRIQVSDESDPIALKQAIKMRMLQERVSADPRHRGGRGWCTKKSKIMQPLILQAPFLSAYSQDPGNSHLL